MSKYGVTLIVLATQLGEAVTKDEAGEGCDISAGLFGIEVSEWLRDVAEQLSGEKRPVDILPARDQRPLCYAWAPGTYICKCTECDEEFLGDKRATMCAPCAYGDNKK